MPKAKSGTAKTAAQRKADQRARDVLMKQVVTTAQQADAQVTEDLKTYASKVKDSVDRLKIAWQDWTSEFSGIDKRFIKDFVLKELVVNEVQEAARLKAIADEFRDSVLSHHKLTKPQQRWLSEALSKAMKFRQTENAHLDNELKDIWDGLPTKESDIEGLKNVCRDSYRDKTSNGFYRAQSQWRQNVRLPTVTPTHAAMVADFHAKYDAMDLFIKENPKDFPPEPKDYRPKKTWVNMLISSYRSKKPSK